MFDCCVWIDYGVCGCCCISGTSFSSSSSSSSRSFEMFGLIIGLEGKGLRKIKSGLRKLKITRLKSLYPQTFIRKIIRYLKTNVRVFKLRTIRWLLRLLKTNVRIFELWKIRWWLLRKLAKAEVRFLLPGTRTPRLGLVTTRCKCRV